MRNLFLLTLLGIVTLFMSCSNEQSPSELQIGEIIDASIMAKDQANQTRVDYTPNSDGNIYLFSWSEGDAISIIVPSTENTNQKFTTSTAASLAIFDGKIVTWSDDKNIYAVYPYLSSGYNIDSIDGSIIIDNSSQSIDLSQSSKFQNCVMVASASGESAALPALSFKQTMSIFQINLVDIPATECVVELRFEAESSLFIESADISLATGEIIAESENKSQKLSASIISQSGSSASINMAILPIDLSGSAIKMIIKTIGSSDGTKEYVKNFDNGINFHRNTFLVSAAGDFSITEDADNDGGSGEYTLASFEGGFIPLYDTWVITDTEAISNDFTDIKEALESLKNSNRKISLEFPNLTAFPNEALNGTDGNNNTVIVSIDSPKVTSIGEAAFEYCTSLETINSPLVTAIGGTAFRCCIELTDAIFPEATNIGRGAFFSCENLINIDFSDATEISDLAFGSCSSLTQIVFPNVVTVGSYAFTSGTASSLKSISFPSATSIGEGAFRGCVSLTELTISEFPNVVTIGEDAFADCSSLEIVDLPKVTSIEKSGNSGAFGKCSTLKEVSLPAVTTVGSRAFLYCDALTTIYLPEASIIEGQAFVDCKSLKNVVLPKLSQLGYEVFLRCTYIETVSLPSITSIGWAAFQYCDALNSLELATATDQTIITEIEDDIFKLSDTQSQEGNISLTIGTGNASNINGNTLTIGDVSYTFKSVNIAAGGDNNVESGGEDAGSDNW